MYCCFLNGPHQKKTLLKKEKRRYVRRNLECSTERKKYENTEEGWEIWSVEWGDLYIVDGLVWLCLLYCSSEILHYCFTNWKFLAALHVRSLSEVPFSQQRLLPLCVCVMWVILEMFQIFLLLIVVTVICD